MEVSNLRDAVGMNGCCPSEGQYGHVCQSCKNRHPLIQSSTSRHFSSRYPVDVFVRILVMALFMMTKDWKPAKGPLVEAAETNDGNWMMESVRTILWLLP